MRRDNLMKKENVLPILVGIGLFLAMPVGIGIFSGIKTGSLRTCLISAGIFVLLEFCVFGIFAWLIHRADKEANEKLERWRQEGLSEIDICKLLLEERRSRLNYRLDMSYGNFRENRNALERMEIREELRDVEDRLQRLSAFSEQEK